MLHCIAAGNELINFKAPLNTGHHETTASRTSCTLATPVSCIENLAMALPREGLLVLCFVMPRSFSSMASSMRLVPAKLSKGTGPAQLPRFAACAGSWCLAHEGSYDVACVGSCMLAGMPCIWQGPSAQHGQVILVLCAVQVWLSPSKGHSKAQLCSILMQQAARRWTLCSQYQTLLAAREDHGAACLAAASSSPLHPVQLAAIVLHLMQPRLRLKTKLKPKLKPSHARHTLRVPVFGFRGRRRFPWGVVGGCSWSMLDCELCSPPLVHNVGPICCNALHAQRGPGGCCGRLLPPVIKSEINGASMSGWLGVSCSRCEPEHRQRRTGGCWTARPVNALDQSCRVT